MVKVGNLTFGLYGEGLLQLMNRENLHIILQYALLCARQNDDRWDWEIGPIHLVKYAYLADLIYAEKHNGETFTGTDWSFHNFGPWSSTVHGEIPTALNAIGAHVKNLPSSYGDEDYYRWSYLDDDYDSLFEEIGNKVPTSLTFSMQNLVRKYGKDTPDLLDYVYNTKPMRNAAPGEYLDFSVAVDPKLDSEEEKFAPAMASLSIKKKKNLKARIKELKITKLKDSATSQEKRLVPSIMPPIEEAVLREGMDWLDSMAGPPLSKGRHEVEFDESIWKSSVRRMEKY